MEFKVELIETVGKFVVFIMLLLSVFLFTVKGNNKLANKIFGLYLLVLAFDFIGLFTDVTLGYPMIQSLKTASTLLQLPLFYLYVLAACYHNFGIRKKHALHGVLFLAFLFVFGSIGFKDSVLNVFSIVGELQYLVYMVFVFRSLKRYKTVYLENYSNANYAVYKWLFQISILFCAGHTLVLLRTYLSYSFVQEYLLNINVFISLSVLFITTFFVLKALYQPELFTGIDKDLKALKSTHIETKSLALGENDEKEEYLQKLSSYMEQEKPYLNYGLSLQQLAEETAIPEKELSQLINHHLGKHFFDFVNEYRVDYAKKLLVDPGKKEFTVLEVLYQSGFNSKSSFYTAFKKVSSQTPLGYRKSMA